MWCGYGYTIAAWKSIVRICARGHAMKSYVDVRCSKRGEYVCAERRYEGRNDIEQ